MRSLRVLVSLFVSVLVLVALPVAAAAQTEADEPTHMFVVAEGPVEIGADDHVGAMIVTDGDAVVLGEVDTIIAVRGNVSVEGVVNDTAIALDGRVTVLAGATVAGDVYSSLRPDVAGGTVAGSVETVRFTDVFGIIAGVLGVIAWFAGLIGLFLIGLFLQLVAPDAVEASRRVAVGEAGHASLAGLIIAVTLPVIGIVAALTLLGLPFALAVFGAMAMLAAVGMAVTSRALGGLVLRGADHPVLALLIGVVVLQVVGLVPFVGGLVTGLAGAYGIGALGWVVWSNRRRAGRAISGPVAPTPA